MPVKIELIPKAEIGRGSAIIDENKIEIHISGVMGALKAWLLGKENVPVGNIVGGRLIREINTVPYFGILITQSGKQMFYGSWREDSPASEFAPLPDLNWEKITERAFPETAERVRLALSNRNFFDNFKKHGYYLFGKDGERFAIAVKHAQGDPSPFPGIEEVKSAGEYVYVVL